jgi:hypothetical protein
MVSFFCVSSVQPSGFVTTDLGSLIILKEIVCEYMDYSQMSHDVIQ